MSVYEPLARVRLRGVAVPAYAALCCALAFIVVSLVVDERAVEGVALGLAVLSLLLTILLWYRWVRLVGLAGMNPVASLRLSHRLRAAATLYGEGQRAQAAAELEAICYEAAPYPFVHAPAVQALGAVSLALGNAQRARALMRAAERSGWFESFVLRRGGGSTILHAGQVIAEWACGDREEAERHLNVARAHCPRGKHGMLAYAEAYAAARDERFEEVCETHEQRFAALDENHRPLQEVPFRILHAFALERLGRVDDAVHAMSALADAERDGRHASVALGWPEMAAFLERHRLVPSLGS